MKINPITFPQPSPSPKLPTVTMPSSIQKPAPQPQEGALNTQWFKDAARTFDQWNRDIPPLPVTGNQVVTYINLMDYYTALGQAIRKTRSNLADFVYISGWELNLDTFIDPPGVSPRQTLRELLSSAILLRNVEVRVLLPDQPNNANNRSTLEQVAKMKGGGILDSFHKLLGTHHQKLVIIRNAEGVFGFCGGMDIANERLMREGDVHKKEAPWHDVQVRVSGPAAADLWNSFVQRFKELSNRYVNYTILPLSNKLKGIEANFPLSIREPDFAASKTNNNGLNVQVVRTYPNMQKKHFGDGLIIYPRQAGYNFARNGEMSIYNLLNHAISRTSRTIYLEDQYLVNSVSMGQHPPITEALRRTIEKSSFIKMIILIAGNGTVEMELCQVASRRAEFIKQLGPLAAKKVAVYAYKGDNNSPYWLHSKTWIFDDQFTVVSSANCNRRGYSYDSEIGVGISGSIINGQIPFAQRLRMDLWLKHLNQIKEGSQVQQSRKLGDFNVKDFAAAASLWDTAPLLQNISVDLTQNVKSDIPLINCKNLKFKGIPPDILKDKDIHNRDFEWSLIDPDGS
ncbi:phospholipase D-like domain-containing protein [Bacillus mycoides]|uniref:phospholipase D-like domain-containing protein n=1 Tax=Bacillus mycoides TaxID=1405 RepID=UPI002E1F810B|nr:phospholipase D-like domain-containing protein [Bacillus mycoides]